ncbi:MAG: hypothetical protein ACRD9S_14595 [Pyrinomonadaceae bacterium]
MSQPQPWLLRLDRSQDDVRATCPQESLERIHRELMVYHRQTPGVHWEMVRAPYF